MPIYDSDEHELLTEESVLTRDDASIENGILYLTDKKLIYEKKGSRKLLSAEPSKIYLMVPVYNIENVSSAVPVVKLFTKKRIRVEFREGTDLKYVEFSVKKPKIWVDEIKKWSSSARMSYMETIRRQDEEQFRRDLELTKAKSPRNNINMINLGTPRKGEPGYVKNDFNNQDTKDVVAVSKNLPENSGSVCPECGAIVDKNSKFCKNCGAKLK
jgi:hypothetical protein